MWLFDGNGEFTVRSCYRHLVEECSKPDAAFWKKVWSLELPGNIHFFLWRTCRFCLPTSTALAEKRVIVDSICSWCRAGNETAKQVLFECKFAKEVWESSSMAVWTQTLPGETIMDHFNRLFQSGSKEQCVLLTLLCWSIWNRHNNWMWNHIAASVFGTTSATMSFLFSWKTNEGANNRCNQAIERSGLQKWQVPQRHWVKINVDAVIFMDLTTIGIGGVVRDENGMFLRAMCKQKGGEWTPREAEALSLREVLSWLKNSSFKQCVFETDSKLLADDCNGGPGRSYFHSIVSEHVDLFKHIENVLVCFVPRFANRVAHLLARVSRSMSGLQEWDSDVPNFLSDVLLNDLN